MVQPAALPLLSPNVLFVNWKGVGREMSVGRGHLATEIALEESFPRVWIWDQNQGPMSSKQQDLHIGERDRAQEEAFIVPVRECHDRKSGFGYSGRAGSKNPGIYLLGHWGY